MINLYVVGSLLITLAVLIGMTLYVLPKNWKEVRRRTSDRWLFRMRIVIMTITLSILLFSILPVAYQITRLDMVTEPSFQNIAGLSGALRMLSFGVGWIGIHLISDILIHRDKKKEEEDGV